MIFLLFKVMYGSILFKISFHTPHSFQRELFFMISQKAMQNTAESDMNCPCGDIADHISFLKYITSGIGLS